MPISSDATVNWESMKPHFEQYAESICAEYKMYPGCDNGWLKATHHAESKGKAVSLLQLTEQIVAKMPVIINVFLQGKDYFIDGKDGNRKLLPQSYLLLGELPFFKPLQEVMLRHFNVKTIECALLPSPRAMRALHTCTTPLRFVAKLGCTHPAPDPLRKCDRFRRPPAPLCGRLLLER